MYKFLFKILIVGDGGVGKTTILYRYVDGRFLEDTKMTVGTNFFIKDIDLPKENAKIKFQIWDLGGQEHFAAIRQNFYAGAKGVIYVFDLTRRYSFNNLLEWRDEVETVIGKEVPSILIGNKLDLISNDSLDISQDELTIMKEELHFSNYFKTSAKENFGIHDAFHQMGLLIFQKYQQKD
jgi:small GTP-binding protein